MGCVRGPSRAIDVGVTHVLRQDLRASSVRAKLGTFEHQIVDGNHRDYSYVFNLCGNVASAAPCTPCQVDQIAGCPTEDYCIEGACMQGWYTDLDMCAECLFDMCVGGMSGCLGPVECSVEGETVPCMEEHPSNPYLVCGHGGEFYPNYKK